MKSTIAITVDSNGNPVHAACVFGYAYNPDPSIQVKPGIVANATLFVTNQGDTVVLNGSVGVQKIRDAHDAGDSHVTVTAAEMQPT